jgi:hypothetical protein
VNAGHDFLLSTPGAIIRVDAAAPAASIRELPAANSDPLHLHLINCVWLC